MLIWLAVEVMLNWTLWMWVGCKLIGEEGEGASVCCLLKSQERVPLLLVPQGMSPTVDVGPAHVCDHWYYIAQLLQHPELRVFDLMVSQEALRRL